MAKLSLDEKFKTWWWIWLNRPIHRYVKTQDLYGCNTLERISDRLGKPNELLGYPSSYRAATVRDIIIPDLCRIAAKTHNERIRKDIINYGNMLATGIYH